MCQFNESMHFLRQIFAEGKVGQNSPENNGQYARKVKSAESPINRSPALMHALKEEKTWD